MWQRIDWKDLQAMIAPRKNRKRHHMQASKSRSKKPAPADLPALLVDIDRVLAWFGSSEGRRTVTETINETEARLRRLEKEQRVDLSALRQPVTL
jgi:hypothetical protein